MGRETPEACLILPPIGKHIFGSASRGGGTGRHALSYSCFLEARSEVFTVWIFASDWSMSGSNIGISFAF